MSNDRDLVRIYPPSVILEDDPIHHDPYPFCSDSTCPCHEPANNAAVFALLTREHAEGVLTFNEALRIVEARQANS